MASAGYSASQDELLKRLARIEGQVRGVSRMVEEQRYCIDVLTQIGAIRGALDRVALGLVDEHARNCMIGSGTADAEDRVEELMGALERLVSR